MTPPRALGRFELRREVGRGIQSEVELAWDPKEGREVAIKVVHYPPADRRQLNPQLLASAAQVVALRHPRIVPLYECGEHGGLPYLVQEYAPGPSLADSLTQAGPWPCQRAARLARGVAEALAVAHHAGIVHRNLTPANIRLTEDGSPRVMDFACPPRVDELADIIQQGLLGTPAYLAPEYIQHKTVAPAGDIYALGLILMEAIQGHPLVSGDSVGPMLHRIMNEDVLPPPQLDPALADIARRCCARDPAQRYADMDEVVAALDRYLAESPEADNEVPSVAATVLAQIGSADDALAGTITAINQSAPTEQEAVTQLTNTVLQTPALTDKVVQLANLVYGPKTADGAIGTLSRAAVLLGLDALRNLAITVLLAESLQGKPHGRQLTEAYLKATLAGLLARDLSHSIAPPEADEAFTGALFHGLGEMLIWLHFPDKAEAVNALMAGQGLDEATASAQVLGMSYEALGLKASQTWGFSAAIRYSMHRLPEGYIPLAATREEILRVIVAFAQDASQLIAAGDSAAWASDLAALADRYAENLNLPAARIRALVGKSAEDLAQIAAILGIDLTQSDFAQQLDRFSRDETTVAPPPAVDEDAPNAETPAMDALLEAGGRDMDNSLAENATPNDILAIMLETLYRALGFQRVLLCLKDAKAEHMVARIGFGMEGRELRQRFRFSTAYSPDVFHLSLKKGADILIDNTDDPNIADKIPDWFRRAMPAKTFVLFPLVVKGKPVALIYGDKDEAGSIHIPKEQVHRLKGLRDRAAAAFRPRA
ncbi:hypothetical protein DLREEDagrD3_08120 [Denitratisoma sp. agr-D3]